MKAPSPPPLLNWTGPMLGVPPTSCDRGFRQLVQLIPAASSAVFPSELVVASPVSAPTAIRTAAAASTRRSAPPLSSRPTARSRSCATPSTPATAPSAGAPDHDGTMTADHFSPPHTNSNARTGPPPHAPPSPPPPAPPPPAEPVARVATVLAATAAATTAAAVGVARRPDHVRPPPPSTTLATTAGTPPARPTTTTPTPQSADAPRASTSSASLPA